MLFAVILVLATLVAWAVARRNATNRDHARRGMALAMVVAGVAHLAGPEPFVQHLPEWVPAREPLVHLTGGVEIALGLSLLAWRSERVLAGRLLALYLLAVWPANVYVAVAGVDVDGQPGGTYAWLRLPFQALFIAWALWSTRPAPVTRPGTGAFAPPAAVAARTS